MDTQLTFIFILLFLSILLMFYYTKLESNIIILLSIILILLINYIIVQTEYFQSTNHDRIIQNLHNYLKTNNVFDIPLNTNNSIDIT